MDRRAFFKGIGVAAGAVLCGGAPAVGPARVAMVDLYGPPLAPIHPAVFLRVPEPLVLTQDNILEFLSRIGGVFAEQVPAPTVFYGTVACAQDLVLEVGSA